jgi:hypothetical protein
MANEPLDTAFRHLRRLALPQGDGGLSDAQLLERFVTPPLRCSSGGMGRWS